MNLLDNVGITVDKELLQKYKKLTGDTDSQMPLVYTVIIETETGLPVSEAKSKYSLKELSEMVTRRIIAELDTFGGL